jgi:hypothetical protein
MIVKAWIAQSAVNGYRFIAQVLSPSRDIIFLSTTILRLALEPIKPPIRQILGIILPGTKQLECGAEKSPPYFAEVFRIRGNFPLLRLYVFITWLQGELYAYLIT